jgi:Recombinase
MPTQRLRDVLSKSPTLEYLNHMNSSGWKLVALEWERESDSPTSDPPEQTLQEIEVPYGMQISQDGWHLVENAAENRILVLAIDMIVDDSPMSGVADELNRQGFRTRRDSKWTAGAVFDLLPRMIEAGPRIFTTEEWARRRPRVLRD